MKNKMFAVAILAASIGGGSALIATNAFAKAPAISAPAKHPEIRKALNQLNNAMNTMKNAADDFAGHKVDAMKATQHAIDELHTALKDAGKGK